MKALYKFRVAPTRGRALAEKASRIIVSATSLKKAMHKANQLSSPLPKHVIIESITEIEEN